MGRAGNTARGLQRRAGLRARKGLLLAGIAAAGVGCSTRGDDPRPGLESNRQAIFGGQLATVCQYPSTVLLSGCTGTLVHPQIVITAAHCGTGHKTATFGEGRTGRKVAIQSCMRFGNGNDAAMDYAFCKLATPVTDVPIAPVLMGCELDVLKPGRPIIEAGFGDADDKGGGFGTKRWVETTFNKLQNGAANVGGNGHGYCFGDSGGPAFVKLDDGTWRSFGIVSEGLGKSCGAGDRIGMMSTAVPWIEKTSGIDITPCHDADGKWNPGPGCHGFSLDPGGAGRAWANGCAEAALSPPSATCGAAYNGPPSGDPAPPGPGDAAAPAPDPQPGDAGNPGRGDARARDGGGGRRPDATGPTPEPDPPGTNPPPSSDPMVDASARPGPAPAGRDGGTPGKPGTGPADPSPAFGGSAPGGGCSMVLGGRVEDGVAVLAVLAFGLAFMLRRRWFDRGRRC